MIRSFIAMALLAAALLSACGGGGAGSSSPTAVPTGNVTGYAVDALIQNGSVQVYDFQNGVRGAVLGTGLTDASGAYRITIQTEVRQILIEVTGGFYFEEASRSRIDLQPNQNLTAVVNYQIGQSVTVSATPFTHLATALTLYRYRNGMPLSNAIDLANNEISGLIGVDILRTRPLDITDSTNASPFLNPGLQYGFMTAAISSWTADAAALSGVQTHRAPYNSINFAQLMYDDALHDGLLNGIGAGPNDTVQPLALGAVALNQDVYRHKIAVHLLRMASSDHNAVSITPAVVLETARQYNSNNAPIFADAPITALSESGAVTSIITPTIANTWLRNAQNFSVRTASILGPVVSLEVLVDGNPVSGVSKSPNKSPPSTTAVTYTDWAFSINTQSYVDGRRALEFRATDVSGFTTTTPVVLPIDNNPPRICFQYAGDSSNFVWYVGTWTDTGSGMTSIEWAGQYPPVSTSASTNDTASGTWGSIVFAWRQWNIASFPFNVRDAAGNTASYVATRLDAQCF